MSGRPVRFSELAPNDSSAKKKATCLAKKRDSLDGVAQENETVWM